MAVQSATSRIQYAGNNSTTTSYAVPFVFLENSHLQAIARTSAGVESTVTLTNHTGAGDVNGGTVRTSVAVPATSTLTIYREVPATQTTQYQEGGDFPAASHERALDKLTQIAQQNTRQIGNSLRLTEANPIAVLSLPTAAGQHVLATAGSGTAPSFQSLGSLSIGPVIATGTTLPRSVQDRFADVVNVRDFGVVGDGVADDTIAFTNALRAFFNGDKLHLDLNGLNIGIATNIVIRFGADGFNADAGIRATRLGRGIHNGRLVWIGASNAGTMLDIGTNISVVASAALKSFTFENVQFDAQVNSKSLVRVFNFYVLTFASCQFLNFSNATAVFLPSNDDSNNYTDDNGACFYDCRWACLPSSANHTGTPILAYCGDLVVSRGFAEWCGPFDFHIGHILIEGLHWSFGNVSSEMRLAAIFRDPRQIQVLNCDNDNCGLLFTTAGYAANTTQGAATNIRNIIVSGNKYGVKDVPAGNGVITFEFTNAGTSFRNTYIGGNSCTAAGVAAPVSFLKVKTSGSGTLGLATNFYQFTEAVDVNAGDKDFGTAALGASNFSTYVGTDNLISRGFFVNSQAGIRNDTANGIRFDAGNSEKWTLLSDGTFSPKTTNTHSIGSAGLRCASVNSNSFDLGPTPITISFRTTGTPEGNTTAPVGSIIVRADGGTSTTLYVKESGTGNTGWVAK
jgi:hypothetical protein